MMAFYWLAFSAVCMFGLKGEQAETGLECAVKGALFTGAACGLLASVIMLAGVEAIC